MKLILPFSILMISIIIFSFVVKPVFSDVQGFRANKVIYSEALNESTELQKIRDSLLDKYNNIKTEDKDRLDHFLPRNVDDINLVLEIEKIANIKGIPVKDIIFNSNKTVEKEADSSQDKKITTNNINTETQKTKEDSLYETFDVEFTVDTTYDTFISFLKDLEYNLRLINIKSISFSVPEKSDKTSTTSSDINKINPNIYSFKLKIETYWFK